MRCQYCFYEDESLFRTQKSYGFMSEECLDKLIASAVEATNENALISFGFQGGEPTLRGLDFYKHLVEEEKKYRNRKYIHSIQTNGLALNEDWARFFSENDFLVGLSIDGYRELHDLHRIDAGKNGTFSAILENLRILKKYNVECNALCVVTKQCAQKPHKAYQRLKQLGFRYIQFIACLDPLGKERGMESYSLLPEEYASFLCETFDDWYSDWKKGRYVSIRQFDDYISLLLNRAPSSCAASGKCGRYIVAEADGSLFPCDFYMIDEWCLGNVNHLTIAEALDSDKAKAFRADKGSRPAECFTCRWKKICHGGCKRDISFSERVPENYYCQAYKKLFAYAETHMLGIATQILHMQEKE